MNRTKLSWIALVIVAVIALLVRGETKDGVAVSVRDVGKIRAAVGKELSVSGRVAKTNVSGGGTHFLNFAGTDFKAVCLADLVKKFPQGGPAKLYQSKQVIITGKVELYKGSPQIKLTDPSQIRVLGERSSGGDSEKPFELKQVGNLAWASPAGLRYEGRDPQGKTRVEHIMRHCQDQPRRAGKHGVFDPGDHASVFALIDEAWQRAQRLRLRPRVEGARSVYDVSMGRRVGYLGGRVGAQRKNPSLKKVRIVFETGSKRIVTAFPN